MADMAELREPRRFSRRRLGIVGLLSALAGGGAGALLTWIVLDQLHPTGAWFNDLVRALAVLLSAVAWPAVVVFIAVRHKTKLEELLDRVRAVGGGTRFAPPPQQQPLPSSPIPGPGEGAAEAALAPLPGAPAPPDQRVDPAAGLPPDLAAQRSYVVVETEKVIATAADQSGLQGDVRAHAYLTAAAVLSVHFRFERLEGLIWASQLALLTHINQLTPPGVDQRELRERFYDPAAATFKSLFDGYSFQQYLDFLRSGILIIDGDDDRIAITYFGREYLSWRAREGRFEKRYG